MQCTKGGSRQGRGSGSGGSAGTGGAQDSVAVESRALDGLGTSGSADGGTGL